MFFILLLIGISLAATGALIAESIRVFIRWLPQIAPAYGTAAGIAAGIVTTQAVLGAILSTTASVSTGTVDVHTFSRDLLIVLIVGPALHGITWILVLHAWQSMRSLIGGSRSPWQ